MPFFYDLGLALYHVGIKVAAPFKPKAKAWIEGRRTVFGTLELKRNRALRGCIWMHCASVGEFEQGRPVLEALKARWPERPVLITFYSPSGYEACKEYAGATHVEFLPADGAKNASDFLDLVQPSMVLWVRYEFWYHWLHTLKQRSIPVFLVSGIFRPMHPFFRWYGGTHRRMLGFFTHLFVQDEASRDLLANLGVMNVSVSGDTRFDRVMSIVQQAAEGHPNDPDYRTKMEMTIAVKAHPMLVAGSTWPADTSLIQEAIKDPRRSVGLVIAPHETPTDDEVMRLVRGTERSVVRWSNIVVERYTPSADSLLLVDVNGYLSRMYAYADITYVGGGFGDGIHSLLEAAAWSKPVIFGPNHQKFAEAKGLIDAGGGFEVRDAKGLAEVLDRLINDPSARREASEAAGRYVRERVGATDRIVRAIVHAMA